MSKGILYIVSTPIGNLEDITLRALRILKEVDLIAAEDTRHSLKLLSHYGISKPMISYWGEKEKTKAEEAVRKLSSGLSVALISDAGTPGIADPGSVLVKRALEERITVVPIPGPSAAIAALSVSGFSADEFVFAGFLPPKSSHRRKALVELSFEKRTMVMYEAPHRIVESLADIEEFFGDRRAFLTREITKIHEESVRGTLHEIRNSLRDATIAGEYVIVVEGRGDEQGISCDDALAEIGILMKKGFGRKNAAKKVAKAYGLSPKELYDRSLQEE